MRSVSEQAAIAARIASQIIHQAGLTDRQVTGMIPRHLQWWRGKRYRPNGARECARRQRQMAAGQLKQGGTT